MSPQYKQVLTCLKEERLSVSAILSIGHDRVTYAKQLAKNLRAQPCVHAGHLGQCHCTHEYKCCLPWCEECVAWSLSAAVDLYVLLYPANRDQVSRSIYRYLQTIYVEDYMAAPPDQRLFMMTPSTEINMFLLTVDRLYSTKTLVTLMSQAGL